MSILSEITHLVRDCRQLQALSTQALIKNTPDHSARELAVARRALEDLARGAELPAGLLRQVRQVLR